jgi:hypothetical protein
VNFDDEDDCVDFEDGVGVVADLVLDGDVLFELIKSDEIDVDNVDNDGKNDELPYFHPHQPQLFPHHLPALSDSPTPFNCLITLYSNIHKWILHQHTLYNLNNT